MEYIDILQAYYGFTSLKAEQKEIIDSVVEGKDTIGLLPTGFGKSITFQIPALVFEGTCIVVTPLIALMEDQVHNLKQKGIYAEQIHSLQDEMIQSQIYKRLREGKIKLLYVSAERLQTKRFIEEIKSIHVSLLVLDEAHTLTWSEDFRVALAYIPRFVESLGYRPIHLALTATATPSIIDKIKVYLNLANPKIVSADFDRKNIFYRVAKPKNKLLYLKRYIHSRLESSGIIYCMTIRSVEYLYDHLIEEGYNVGMYHGQLEAVQKEHMQKDFTDQRVKIMICTNAFGMGIDIPFIRYVIEYEIPKSLEDFSQQSGRAARDGGLAECVILFDLKDIDTANYFIENIRNKDKTEKEIQKIKKERRAQLDEMIKFCFTRKCLHSYLSSYFGQRGVRRCMMCSNCKSKE